MEQSPEALASRVALELSHYPEEIAIILYEFMNRTPSLSDASLEDLPIN